MKMRLKNFILSSLSLLTVFGCRNKTVTSSIDSSSSENITTSTTTDSSTVIDKSYTPASFNDAISNYRVNFTGDFFSLDFFGEDAIYITPVGNSILTGSGYVHLEKDKSVWSFELDSENKFVLGDVLYGSVSDGVDFLKSMNRYQALDTLINDVEGTNWKSIGEHTYKTTDSDTIQAYLILGGFVSGYSTYSASSLTMTTSENEVNITGEVNRKSSKSETTMDFNLKVTNIGNNKNESLDEFINNPIISDVNDFSQEFKDAMTSLVGFSFEYDSNLTKYCYFDMNEDDLYYEDHRSGDLTSSFATQLINKGFTIDDSQTKFFNGATSYTYTKVLSKQIDSSPQVTAEITLQYCPKSYYVTTEEGVYDGLYENGLFMIRVNRVESLFYTDISDMNYFLSSKYKKDDGTSLIPTLNFTGYDSITMSDQMAVVGGLKNIVSDYKITGSFSTGSEALSALQSWENALKNNGFNLYTTTSSRVTYKPLSESNNDTFYKYSDSSNPNIVIELIVGKTYNTETKKAELDGSFVITIGEYLY